MKYRYVIYFIPETGFYTFYDAFAQSPMRHVNEDEIVSYCPTITTAHLVVDSLNAMGLI